MASDPRRRQKKLARKKSKRKARVAAVRKAGSNSQSMLVAAAARGPVERCQIPPYLFDTGMGSLFFSRRSADGTLITAAFLLDTFCLGVKDSFALTVSASELDQRLAEQGQTYVDIAPACARKLLHGVVAYANGLGLRPHKDYAGLERIFGDIDPQECDIEFEFGRDGQPLFIPGPHDDPAMIRRVERALGRY